MKFKDIAKSVKLPARASVYYLMASGIGKVVSFFIIPFSTRLMTSEEYGQLSLYMALLGGATVICSSFSSSSAVYKGIQDHDDNKNEYLMSVLWITWAFSALICILLFAFRTKIKLDPFLLLPLSVQILCDEAIAVSMCSRRFYYQYKSVVAVSIISAVVPSILSIIVLKIWGGGYYARIFSTLLVSLCLAAYCLINFFKTKSKAKAESIKYVMQTSLPLLPHAASSAFLVQADKLIITSLLGAAALAKYSVVYSLGIALQFTVTAICSALSPWMIRRLKTKEDKIINRLIYPMTMGYFALSICLIAIAPEAMRILAPAEYGDALPAILPLALSTPFYFITTVATVGLVQARRSSYSIIISAVSALLCVGLNYALVGRLGFLGAGIVTLICNASSAILSIYLLGKSGHREMLHSKKIALPFLLSSTLGILIHGLNDSLAARMALLSLPAIIIVYCMIRVGALIIEKDGKVPS